MKDQWTDRLSEYLDGDLTPAERTTLEAHLAACGTCRTTLDELRRVVARAQALDDRPPAADLWPGIAEHIGVVSLAARREGGAGGGGGRRLSVARAPESTDAPPPSPGTGHHRRHEQRGHVPAGCTHGRLRGRARTDARAQPQPARHRHGPRDREESRNHRPGDPRRTERPRGRSRECLSEPAPRPGNAA